MATAEDLAAPMEIPMEAIPEAPEEAPVETEPTEAEKPDNQKEVETLLAQKEHWRKKALKAEEDMKKFRPSQPSQHTTEDEFRPRVEFLLENRDLEGNEYDHLATVAMRTSGKITLDSLRAAKDSEKGYLGYLRKQRSQANKIPGSTVPSGSPNFQKSPEDIAKMSSAELLAYDRKMMEWQDRGI